MTVEPVAGPGEEPALVPSGGRGAVGIDAVVVGAGFAGLYALLRLRQLGFSTLAIDEAADVGGTWYWNRYPGARCDIPTTDYTYSFDPELEKAWTWSEKYATQPEILAYLQLVADRYDLRRDIRFSTRLVSARWDERSARWQLRTGAGEELSCRFTIMATGCLSVPKALEIEGAERFQKEMYFTSRWPQQAVDFSGKRVAVVGTGSSGIQVVPCLAAQAARLTVFQRTPSFSVPARNGPPPAERLARLRSDRAGYRHAARCSHSGVPWELTEVSGVTATEEQRRQRFEEAWEAGELDAIMTVFNDQLFDAVSNGYVAEMIRERIRAAVDDPEVAEALCPKSYPFGTKRPCLDTGYYSTFNLPHVRLVDLRDDPIVEINASGIRTATGQVELDAIVNAIGFDAVTGALTRVEVTGRGGLSLRQKWASGASTYLGLMTGQFPNLFFVTGPGSPSVLSNMVLSIEQHVEWVTDCLQHMRTNNFERIEPTETAEAGWNRHVSDCAAITLYPQADSWYMGANVPGKARMLLPYVGGVGAYRAACDEVSSKGYLGFNLTGPSRTRCREGVVRRLQPDVAMVLRRVETLGAPPDDSLTAGELRAQLRASLSMRPPPPTVGEVLDGTLPGPDGALAYRLYRPPSSGPHAILAYFHGGGWVAGDLDIDDPLCRDLCRRVDAIVVSVDYRLAPEAPFPAAVDDAYSALSWIASNASRLGAAPEQLLVGGLSAGANLAAVCCQLARDKGGPELLGQLLLNPVTDCDLSRTSYHEYGEGFLVTTSMMRWYWSHYAEPARRADPRASPLRGRLAGLPPAVVVTAELDPVRDEGTAYADALAAAGVAVEHIRARGHVHASLAMVGVVLSGAPVRGEIAQRVKSWIRR